MQAEQRETLDVLQRRFFRIISQPAPPTEAALELAVEEPGASPIDRWVRGTEHDAAARLNVYARMYFARLRDSLREDFPCLAALLGDDAFDRLVADYFEEHPSTAPSLHHLGDRMPAFVGDHEQARSRPDAADIAKIERARLAVFGEADAATLNGAMLRAVPPERWGEIVLRFVPAVRIVELGYAADDVWHALDRGQAPPEPRAERRGLLVWRCDFIVRHRPLDADELAPAYRMQKGTTLGHVCELIAHHGDHGGRRTGALLSQWITDQWLVAI